MAIDAIYEQRLVLYADILGWKAATDGGDAEALLSALQELHQPAGVHNEGHRADLRQRERSGQLRVNPMFLEVQFAVFSDNFIFSMPASFERRILSSASRLVVGLLRRGFLVRGAITLGKLYHRDNVVFGPALNEAVRIETQEAIYPRILVDDAAAEYLRASKGAEPREPLMITDQTGRIVANPLTVGMDAEPELIASYVRTNFCPAQVDTVIEREMTRLREAGLPDQAAKWTYMRQFIDGPAFDASPTLKAAWIGGDRANEAAKGGRT